MSEFEFWRLAGMAHEASGKGQKASVGAGKGGGFGRLGMSANADDETQFQMNARVSKERVKSLPRASAKLGRSPSKGGGTHARPGRSPLPHHAPANPAAASYRHVTAPAAGPSRGPFLRANSNTMQRAQFKGTQKNVGTATSRQQLATALRNKAIYMSKDGKGRDGERPDAFTNTEDTINARSIVDRWIDEGDISASWHFISPEHGNRIDDFKDYMRRVMLKAEADILTKRELRDGHRLEWFGVEHGDRPHRHGHVVIRHRVNGRHIRIDDDYLNHGMSVRAREAATEFLGERSWKEIEATEAREKTQEYQDERLSKQIMKRTLGWRLEAKLNMRDLDGVDRLRGALRSAKIHHKLNDATGDITVFSSTHATSLAAAEAIAGDFGSLLRLPDADSMNRGIQFAPRIWGRFVTPKTDERFAQTGVAGIPLMHDDQTRIQATTGDKEMAIDRAVLNANEALSRTYREKLIGRGAGDDEHLVTHGWVLNINADHHFNKVASELTDLGIQYRIGKTIDAHGAPALMVVAYAGSMDDAEYITGHIAGRMDGGINPIDRTDDHARYRFADGIDGRFIPHADDRAMFGVGDNAEYLNGLPATHFSQPGMTPEQKVAVAEDFLAGHYGSYLHGSSGDEHFPITSAAPSAREPTPVSASVEQAAAPPEKQQAVKVERKPDGLEL